MDADRELQIALWKCGWLESEEVPQLAAQWLAEGLDSPSLRQLAGIEIPIHSDVGPIFERSLRELGLTLPTRNEALLRIARNYAQQIVDGKMTPYEGARKIWWQVSNEFDGEKDRLLAFVGAASELEELPDRRLEDGIDRERYRRELNEMIVSAERELLANDRL